MNEEAYMKMREARDRAAMHSHGDLIKYFPQTFAVCLLITVVIAAIFAIFGPEPVGPAQREAVDKAHLECRLAGGSYEWFRSQGYVCIPPR